MKELNEEIRSGRFQPVYLLYGEEAYLKLLYKNKFKKALLSDGDTMNLSEYEGKNCNITQIIAQAETMPFFASHRLILVENSGFFKTSAEALANYLPQMPQETILVFLETEIDKRGKLYRAVKKQGRIVELGRQDEKTLTNWVLGKMKKENKQIKRSAMELFFQRVGNDMELIENELEKLFSYTLGKDLIEKSDVETICTVTIENRIFDMIRAVMEKRRKQALDLYYDLLAQKEPPLKILFLIARQFQMLFLIKDLREQGFDTEHIAQKSGIQPFLVKRCMGQIANFDKKTLQQAVEDCVELETAVKTGKINDTMAAEILIMKYSESRE